MTKCCLFCYKISSLSNSDHELYESKMVTEVKGSTITVLFEDYGINLVHSLGGYTGVEQTTSFARILVGKLIILKSNSFRKVKGHKIHTERNYNITFHNAIPSYLLVYALEICKQDMNKSVLMQLQATILQMVL